MQQLEPGQHVLVLGGSGFIGSHLLPELVREGFEVTNYDLYAPDAPLPPEVTSVRGDIRDRERLTAALRGELGRSQALPVDAVLNLAAAHHDFGVDAGTFQSVNVGGAEILTEAMAQVGIKNLCFYSSVAIYGNATTPPNETTPPSPVNEYGRTKYLAEITYQQWLKADSQRRLLILRPAVVFGPRNFANVYRMIHQIASGRFLAVGPGTNYKSMVYVENIVAAIMWLWQQPPLHPADTYNCVDKPDLTSKEIIQETFSVLGKQPPRLRIPLAPALILSKPFDLIAHLTGKNLPITSARIQKISQAETRFDATRLAEVGFKAPLSLQTGLKRMVKWYLNEGRTMEHVDHLPPAGVVEIR